jgi:hypothetical protein
METFDINSIKDNETVFIIGRRNCGKTHIIKQILKTKKHMNTGVIFDPLDSDENPKYKSYRKIIKKEYIFDEYNPKIMESLFKYQEKRLDTKLYKEEYCFVVLDNCFFNRELITNEEVNSLILNARSFRIFPIISISYYISLPHRYIANIDKFFIFNTNNKTELQRIYRNLTSDYFETYEEFIEVFKKYTCNGGCMVFDRSQNISKKMYKYNLNINN